MKRLSGCAKTWQTRKIMFLHHLSNFCAQPTAKLRQCIEQVRNSAAWKLRGLMYRKSVDGIKQNIQSVYCDEAEREKFSAKLFSILSRPHTLALPFLYPVHFATVSFALCSGSSRRRRIVRAETYIERQMRLEIWSAPPSCWHFLRRKKSFFFFAPTDGPSSLLCVPSSKRFGDLCLSGKWLD